MFGEQNKGFSNHHEDLHQKNRVERCIQSSQRENIHQQRKNFTSIMKENEHFRKT